MQGWFSWDSYTCGTVAAAPYNCTALFHLKLDPATPSTRISVVFVLILVTSAHINTRTSSRLDFAGQSAIEGPWPHGFLARKGSQAYGEKTRRICRGSRQSTRKVVRLPVPCPDP